MNVRDESGWLPPLSDEERAALQERIARQGEPVSPLRSGIAKLREGTEVLRTGGGALLTAAQCSAILDYIDTLEANRRGR